MKQKHRLRLPKASGPRYRFTLLKDSRAIKTYGLAQGVLNAYEQKKAGLELSAEAVRAGAISAALLVEQETVAGRHGCNEPVAFRQLFADWCTRLHLAMTTYLEEDPGIYDLFNNMPAKQRFKQAFVVAEKYVDQVDQVPADQPLTMTFV